MIKNSIMLFLVISLGACSTVSYYGQSIQGQMSLLFNRQDIQDVLNNPETDDELKTKLQQALSIREYASNELSLPDNKSYQYYVDVKKPYVVWNVFAAPEFSLSPTSWCYPIVGCVSYRGYFARSDAEKEAKLLQQKNLDVHIGGIAAYSTLGWFNDPLMNTMLHWKERSLAGLIFHELAHQIIYIKNETSFNEAFASSIERLGTIQWLLSSHPEQLTDYLAYLQAQNDFRELLLSTRLKLNALYEKTMDNDKKRMQKSMVIAEMHFEYAITKKNWPKNLHFDVWFAQPINNARLTSAMTYLQDIPAFFQLFIEQKGQWRRFYQAVLALEKVSKEERDRLIEAKRNIKIDYPRIVTLIKQNPNTLNGDSVF